MEYVNKNKYELARAESVRTGEDMHDIYVRMGGLVIEHEPKQEAEKPKKTKKK